MLIVSWCCTYHPILMHGNRVMQHRSTERTMRRHSHSARLFNLKLLRRLSCGLKSTTDAQMSRVPITISQPTIRSTRLRASESWVSSHKGCLTVRTSHARQYSASQSPLISACPPACNNTLFCPKIHATTSSLIRRDKLRVRSSEVWIAPPMDPCADSTPMSIVPLKASHGCVVPRCSIGHRRKKVCDGGNIMARMRTAVL